MKKWKVLSNIREFSSQKQIINVLLENRNITEEQIESFFNPTLQDITLESCGIDKEELKNANNLIKETLSSFGKIVIYGDYDVDGICATAILWETLYGVNKNVVPYIPHRIEEGYGLSIVGVDNLLAKFPDTQLIITVDNGIVAYEAASYVKEKGIKLLITDHHVKEKKIPLHDGLLHTTRLCGAGIAYILSQEIKKKHTVKSSGTQFYDNHLELVALATICDLVPLKDINRILVKFGLERLQVTTRPGLIELFKDAGIEQKYIGTYEIGHIIGPRINAMGRIEHGLDSLRLLCTQNSLKAAVYANKLSTTNRLRQTILEETTQTAKLYMDKLKNKSRIVFLAHESYHPGVIGLVASKLVEEFYLPSFVLSVGKDVAKGSARSIYGVNVIEMIRSVAHTLVQAGGHPMAAGFTVEITKLAEFQTALEQKALEIVLDEHLERVIIADCELPFNLITKSLFDELELFQPFGIGNSEPCFISKNVEVYDMHFVGKEKKHLKLKLKSGKNIFDAIAFNFNSDLNLKVGDTIDVAYTIDENTWNGTTKLQLKIKDVHLLKH